MKIRQTIKVSLQTIKLGLTAIALVTLAGSHVHARTVDHHINLHQPLDHTQHIHVDHLNVNVTNWSRNCKQPTSG
jgi:hypothetical protein